MDFTNTAHYLALDGDVRISENISGEERKSGNDTGCSDIPVNDPVIEYV